MGWSILALTCEFKHFSYFGIFFSLTFFFFLLFGQELSCFLGISVVMPLFFYCFLGFFRCSVSVFRKFMCLLISCGVGGVMNFICLFWGLEGGLGRLDPL